MNWKTCVIHGADNPSVWGCPECLRDLREENQRLRAAIGRACAGYPVGSDLVPTCVTILREALQPAVFVDPVKQHELDAMIETATQTKLRHGYINTALVGILSIGKGKGTLGFNFGALRAVGDIVHNEDGTTFEVLALV